LAQATGRGCLLTVDNRSARWEAILWLVALSGGVALAQSAEPVVLPRISGPIALDGVSYELAWQAIVPLPKYTKSIKMVQLK